MAKAQYLSITLPTLPVSPEASSLLPPAIKAPGVLKAAAGAHSSIYDDEAARALGMRPLPSLRRIISQCGHVGEQVESLEHHANAHALIRDLAFPDLEQLPTDATISHERAAKGVPYILRENHWRRSIFEVHHR